MSGGVKALIAVVVVAVVGVGAFLLLSGDDDGGDPAQAVREFFTAAQDRDCERMIALVSEASWSQDGTVTRDEALAECAGEIQDEEFFPADAAVTGAEVASQDGDTAQVEVTIESASEGGSTDLIPVVKEDGRWVVDFASQEIDGSSPPEPPDAGPADG
jgi:hypothetical protein